MSAGPKVGDVLGGRWQLERELGRGGFGAVFQATHLLTGQPAAVKVLLNAEDLRDPKAVGLFLREGRLDNIVTAKANQHLRRGPGSVTVFDSSPGGEGDPPYLAMDLLEGRPLNKVMGDYRGRVPAEVAVPMLEEALSALGAAHKLGIVHRDVKPDNLFRTRAGDTRVLDFGLAQAQGSQAEYGGPGLGTIGYAAPEQVAGDEVDARADVWGAGATLYAMLSGQLPVERSENSIQDPWSQCPVKPLRSVAPQVPVTVARVVDRALECDPARRWQTAEAMRQALRRAVRVQPLLDEELMRRSARSRRTSR
jgi:serine/threonine-protein kinase